MSAKPRCSFFIGLQIHFNSRASFLVHSIHIAVILLLRNTTGAATTPKKVPSVILPDLSIGKRATPPATSTSLSSWRDFGQLKPDQWRCAECRILNGKGALECMLCHFKPGSAAETSEPSVNAEVGLAFALQNDCLEALGTE